MLGFRSLTIRVAMAAAVLTMIAPSWAAQAQSNEGQYQTKDGLAAYLGVVPAGIVKGHAASHPEQTMHGGAPKGRREVHVVVAVFETANSVRVSDASVTAQVSGLGLAGPVKALEPMEIANTMTYGGFFDLPGPDLYKVKLTIQRPGTAPPVEMELTYDNRQ